ncbi:hypothetical protein NDU88_000054 [Pleurodeles waltl]|uniref:Uncharacterized protein n=1 Tax=Pleurodeles waltl TaxID=8319 RepID=A0AAV7VX76_PLEWA|nr:hypothetical protein NDU88_000054 [Pleurodeles waltl]
MAVRITGVGGGVRPASASGVEGSGDVGRTLGSFNNYHGPPSSVFRSSGPVCCPLVAEDGACHRAAAEGCVSKSDQNNLDILGPQAPLFSPSCCWAGEWVCAQQCRRSKHRRQPQGLEGFRSAAQCVRACCGVVWSRNVKCPELRAFVGGSLHARTALLNGTASSLRRCCAPLLAVLPVSRGGRCARPPFLGWRRSLAWAVAGQTPAVSEVKPVVLLLGWSAWAGSQAVRLVRNGCEGESRPDSPVYSGGWALCC